MANIRMAFQRGLIQDGRHCARACGRSPGALAGVVAVVGARALRKTERYPKLNALPPIRREDIQIWVRFEGLPSMYLGSTCHDLEAPSHAPAKIRKIHIHTHICSQF